MLVPPKQHKFFLLIFTYSWYSMSLMAAIIGQSGNINIDVNNDGNSEFTFQGDKFGAGTNNPSTELHLNSGNLLIQTGNLNIGQPNTSSALNIDGHIGYGIQTISDNTQLTGNSLVFVDTSAGSNITLSLPKASNVPGRLYTIKKIDSNAEVSLLGELIDNSLELTLSNASGIYSFVHLRSDGSQYRITGGNGYRLTSTDNLIAWYTFNETSGNVLSDLSRNNYDGTLKNNMTFSTNGTADGIFDRALYIEGPNDDYVDIPFTVLEGRTNLTISCWIKTTKTGNQGIFSAARSTNPDNELLLFYASHTHFQFHDNNTAVAWTGLNSVADGNWHHLCVVRDDTNDQAIFYLDGNSEGSNAITMVPLDVTENGVVMGQEQDNVGGGFQSIQAFEGAIDDFRIYDRILSASEINALYQKGF